MHALQETAEELQMYLSEWLISKFNGTSTPKGSYSAKTGVNCPMSLNRVHKKRMLGQMSAKFKVICQEKVQ